MILLSINIYNWIGNKFLQLTSPYYRYCVRPPFFLQVSCSRDDLLLLFWFIWVYFLFIIKYLKLLIIENTVLISVL